MPHQRNWSRYFLLSFQDIKWSWAIGRDILPITYSIRIFKLWEGKLAIPSMCRAKSSQSRKPAMMLLTCIKILERLNKRPHERFTVALLDMSIYTVSHSLLHKDIFHTILPNIIIQYLANYLSGWESFIGFSDLESKFKET